MINFDEFMNRLNDGVKLSKLNYRETASLDEKEKEEILGQLI